MRKSLQLSFTEGLIQAKHLKHILDNSYTNPWKKDVTKSSSQMGKLRQWVRIVGLEVSANWYAASIWAQVWLAPYPTFSNSLSRPWRIAKERLRPLFWARCPDRKLAHLFYLLHAGRLLLWPPLRKCSYRKLSVIHSQLVEELELETTLLDSKF